MRRIAIASLVALGSLATGLVPAEAQADPVVVVQVRRSGEGEADVTLRDANGTEHHCRTEQGSCRMDGVPPGRFTVTAIAEGGEEILGRPVMILSDGKVMLLVVLF